ncbi:excinuclease ABC subunit UvrC [Microvirga sp. W0021]|uniref:UvrABC system protein C n=1 Tax=Hohaiivirga grylli TaxID=3133970 RepID=A0ABV0BNX1_9HYPH
MNHNRGQDRPPDTPFVDEAEAEDTLIQNDEGESGDNFDLSSEDNLRSVRRGKDVIRNFWETLPNSPGVYRMFDEAGNVLYVGKAKNLKKRVATYARGVGHSNRIVRMIAETTAMQFVTTATETEALLLEANLIKQLKPRYNVLLRDDKSLPYIMLTADHEAPQLVKHRGSRKRAGHYYGPFANAGAVNRTVAALQRAFLLRTCADSYYENRSRPCLLYQIKRCAGPCTREISLSDYQELVNEARGFLSGKSNAIKERIAGMMQNASEQLEFERAAYFRDRLAALSAIQGTQGINTHTLEEADVFALDEQAGQFCVEVFFFRNWQNWGNRSYFPKAGVSTSVAEILASFVAQFYDDKPAPRQVLLSHDVEELDVLSAALSERAGAKVEVLVPKRGERKQVVEYARRNAHEALGRRLSERASQQKLLTALGEAFGLTKPIERVEVYDNSHIMGTNAVGAMIVAGRNGFMKPHYRTFNIKSEELTPGDDYGMMREVLQRRFARLMKEFPPSRLTGTPEAEASSEVHDIADKAFPAWPDLILIDGGKGQLDAAVQALESVGVIPEDVAVVGIAKGRDRDAGRETFFMEGKAPFKLPPRDPTLYFVQRLRDEAHRFAIGTHRAKRTRAIRQNPLDEISGIGPVRKRALLHHFGTVKAIQQASLEDLQRVPGINAATAEIIFDHFHET